MPNARGHVRQDPAHGVQVIGLLLVLCASLAPSGIVGMPDTAQWHSAMALRLRS